MTPLSSSFIFHHPDSFIFAVDYYQSDVNVYSDIADIAETLDLSVYSNCHPIFNRNPERREYLLGVKEANAGVLGVSVVVSYYFPVSPSASRLLLRLNFFPPFPTPSRN